MQTGRHANRQIHSRSLLAILSVLSLAAGLAACAPEVGSEGWCQDMKAKPKGEWTADEASTYAKHCVL